MSNEIEKLASEIRHLKPSCLSKKHGMDAAMAAFNTEFVPENAVSDQGSQAEARPILRNTRQNRVSNLGKNAMMKLRHFFKTTPIFNITPRAAMLGGSCMAALIACFMMYQTSPFDPYSVSTSEPEIVETATTAPESMSIKKSDKAMNPHLPKISEGSTKPVQSKQRTSSVSRPLAEIESDRSSSTVEHASSLPSPVKSGGFTSGYSGTTSASKSPSYDGVIASSSATPPRPTIDRHGATKSGSYTVEGATHSITNPMTKIARRILKSPARTVERIIPATTKEVTVLVRSEDGSRKEITQTVITQEARTELVIIPPVYETITESIIMPAPIPPKHIPQSGRLTAGDYDDVLNPDLYKIYLDKMLQGVLEGKDLPFVDANHRINISVLDRLGKAVPMADISLKTTNKNKPLTLRTGADGMAYLYPHFDGLSSGTKIEISIKGGKTVRKNLSKKLIENGGDIIVDLNTNRQAVKKLDLLLTMDATGSMGDEMRYLQSEIKSIIGRVEQANPGVDIRTGLIIYRDHGDDYVVRQIPFSDDIDDFKQALARQTATGGGDMPEAMHTAMTTGLDMKWRDNAVKVNLLVADAPPHDQDIANTWQSGLTSRAQGIHIVPLAASGVDKTAEFLMRSMAQITGGRFLFLTDDSGIGNPHAKPTVDCYVVTRLDGLLTRTINSLIQGARIEPEAKDVIRSVGNYRSGICAVDNDDGWAAQNVGFEKRR